MLLAGVMSQSAQAVFLLLAVIAFGLAAVGGYTGHRLALCLVGAGLALAFFPSMWNAFALS